eukprot:CAMPEP_0195524470 /NCGR_PEP_ID=MMETSP0794_2-20130614/24319_1 /TAXON_ID=515487 /ORGANISM="Stephanopyxis turris, Strain CCMP 815" /LENGTH=595 /DNA_ID=CAMNT_0040654697 /DNA_START=88 /DNA_END=1875 /DNA_ORIENTATION=+
MVNTRRNIAAAGLITASSFLLLQNRLITSPGFRRAESFTVKKYDRKYVSLLSTFLDSHRMKFETEGHTPVLSQSSVELDANGTPRPFKILAFGGSVTWGTKLPNRLEQAYPNLIGAPHFTYVDNLAIRATGADYPSLCLESMLVKAQVDPNESYDVILLEFFVNGLSGLPQLLNRLKHRYPDAVIVVVVLWSIASSVVKVGTRKSPLEIGRNHLINWVWKENAEQKTIVAGLEDFTSKHINGYVYEFPKPERPIDAIRGGWFSDDWQHLSETGHAIVADGIIEMLTSNPDIAQRVTSGQKQVRSFSGVRDKCINWFDNGKLPSSQEFDYEGAELTNLVAQNPDQHKWVLEFPKTGLIKFNSNFETPVPLTLAYMVRQDPAEYPLVVVRLNGGKPCRLDPNTKSWVRPEAHIQSLAEIGWAHPGENNMTITVVKRRKLPFRVSGIIMHHGVSAKDQEVEQFAQPVVSVGARYGCFGRQHALLKMYRAPEHNGETILFLPGWIYTGHERGFFSVPEYIAAGYDIAVMYYQVPRLPFGRMGVCSNKEHFDDLAKIALEKVKSQITEGSEIVISGSKFLVSWSPDLPPNGKYVEGLLYL